VTPGAGAGEGFEAFYVREHHAVVRLAYALSGSRLAAEDIADDQVEDRPGGVGGQQVVGPGQERAHAQVEPPGQPSHPSGGRRAGPSV
jgi:hypothetical protein